MSIAMHTDALLRIGDVTRR